VLTLLGGSPSIVLNWMVSLHIAVCTVDSGLLLSPLNRSLVSSSAFDSHTHPGLRPVGISETPPSLSESSSRKWISASSSDGDASVSHRISPSSSLGSPCKATGARPLLLNHGLELQGRKLCAFLLD
jgi:hypothetical protein